MKTGKILLVIISVFFIVPLPVFFHASGGPSDKAAPDDAKGREFIIWAHSDIQPQNMKERDHYRIAALDIKENIRPVNAAIVAGDIVQYAESDEDFRWILETRGIASVPYWYEIAGNHDERNIANYFKYMKKPLYYTVAAGNLLIILLSDEVNSSPSEISDHAFHWWEKWVMENQDKTIITVTHAQLPESGLMFSSIYRSKVLGSERFTEVLKKYRVDLWLSGHTTSPAIDSFNDNSVKELNNTLFINISSIRREPGMSVRSRIIYLSENSDEMIIKFRDHDKKKFIDGNERRIKLRAPFSGRGGTPKIYYPGGTIIPE